jgi:hypothetical protein
MIIEYKKNKHSGLQADAEPIASFTRKLESEIDRVFLGKVTSEFVSELTRDFIRAKSKMQISEA